MSLHILSQHTDWCVVNKPPQIHSVSQAKGSPQSMQSQVEALWPSHKKIPEGGIVHRLDFETSGCLLVASHLKSYESLRTQITNGQIKKWYWALTDQTLRPPLEFDFYFSSRYRSSKKISVKTKGKLSERGQCRWIHVKTFKGRYLWEVELIGPGRRHQIRAGLAARGSPLCGDTLYGGHAWIGGLGLHARQIIVEGQSVTAPAPPSWSDFEEA